MPTDCRVASCRTASALRHLSSRCRLTCPSSTPPLCSHRLVAVSHLTTVPPPASASHTLVHAAASRLLMAAASCHAGDSTSRSPLARPNWLTCCLLRHLLLTSTSLLSFAPHSSLPPLSMPRPSPASNDWRRSTQRKAPAAEAGSGRRVGVKRSSLHLQLSCRHQCAYTGEE